MQLAVLPTPRALASVMAAGAQNPYTDHDPAEDRERRISLYQADKRMRPAANAEKLERSKKQTDWLRTIARIQTDMDSRVDEAGDDEDYEMRAELVRIDALSDDDCEVELRKKETATMLVVPQKLILSDAEFTAGFVPPEYLLDGILQRRFCYALTAQTGAGKTAIALRLAAHVGLGRKLGDRDVEQGAVLYFASENSVDVQARWIAMAQHCGFEIGKTNVRFVSGATRLSEIAEQITREAAGMDDLALVIVDTSAATFEGDDENSNVHAIDHAKRMRSLTSLRGGPCVLVLCHPTKRAVADDLIPRGGGAFLAEIDGNLCARKSDSAVEVHWAGKFRGMDFAPMLFQLDTVTATRLKDRRGRNIPTVVAAPLDDAGKAAMTAAGRRDEDVVLRAIDRHPGASSNDLAKALDWTMRDGRPYGVKVRRAVERLAGDGLILKHRGSWALTAKGQRELNGADTVQGQSYQLTPGTRDRNTAVGPQPIIRPQNG